MDTQYKIRVAEFDRASISLSDPITGDLLLYSNGCALYDAEDRVLEDTLNPGVNYNGWCPEGGFPLTKAGFFLPDLLDPKSFKLIHLDEIYDKSLGYITYYLYSTYLLNQNNKWKISFLRKLIHQGMIFRRSIEAIKHANNKDFWIVFSNYTSDTLFRILYTEDGFQTKEFQLVSIPTGSQDWGSSTTMSPDGSKYIRIDIRTGLTVFDFDRLSGLMSNMRYYDGWIPQSEVDNLQIMELSVSPDSRMLYISTPFSLWQLDLQSQDIGASRILIDTFDGFTAPFGTTFYRHQLAPDGKIYMNCTNGDNYMHVIHKPNLRGRDCMFAQHDLKLPSYNAFTLPYFPHYRMGTSSDSNQTLADQIKIYPNPVRTYLTIEKPVYVKVRVLDFTGKMILETHEDEIKVEHWPVGIYYVQIFDPMKNLKIFKIAKI